MAPVSRGKLGMKTLHVGLGAVTVALGLGLTEAPAFAQAAPPPVRSDSWNQATNITAVSAMGLVLLMPRVFYSDPEVTVGWKARWHLSALAPTMTLIATGLVNEQFLKDAFKGYRPGCSDMNQGMVAECNDYGMLSTHSYLVGSALGQGLGV